MEFSARFVASPMPVTEAGAVCRASAMAMACSSSTISGGNRAPRDSR